MGLGLDPGGVLKCTRDTLRRNACRPAMLLVVIVHDDDGAKGRRANALRPTRATDAAGSEPEQLPGDRSRRTKPEQLPGNRLHPGSPGSTRDPGTWGHRVVGPARAHVSRPSPQRQGPRRKHVVTARLTHTRLFKAKPSKTKRVQEQKTLQ